jgi:hypothetical protein
LNEIEREDTPYSVFYYDRNLNVWHVWQPKKASAMAYREMYNNKNVGFPSMICDYMGTFCMPFAAYATYENRGNANMAG